MLLRNLRGRGLRDIRGDIVLDRSLLRPGVADELHRRRRVPALQRHARRAAGQFQVAALRVLPGRTRQVRAVRRAAPARARGRQRAYASPTGRAPKAARSASLIQAELPVEAAARPFTGSYPVICGERELNVALHQPEDYVAGMIRALWTEMGGTWSGRMREGVASPERAAALHARIGAARRDRARHQQVLQQRDGAPALSHARRRDWAARRRSPMPLARAIAQWLVFKGIKRRRTR